MRRVIPSTALCLALSALLPGAAEAQAPIGYAQATGYFKKDSRPTLYQPLNLLDGRETTAWCTPTSDPLDDHLTFGFKGPIRIDEVRIYTGNGLDDASFSEFSRAKKLAIKGPAGAQTLTLADQRGQQVVALNPPLVGQQFTVEVLDQFHAADPKAPVCISDIVFYSEGKALNGPWLAPRLKYDRAQAALMGTWFAGSEGAPDRFLSFYFDGTWRFVYEPWDPAQKGQSSSGEYDAAGNRLTLDTGKGRTTLRLRRAEAAGEEGGARRSLSIEGAAPAEMKQSFRDRM